MRRRLANRLSRRSIYRLVQRWLDAGNTKQKENMETIDISKLDKAEVLAALYNNSRQLGMGFMHARGATGMTKEDAAKEIEAAKREDRDGNVRIYFDYLHGRVMKSEIGGDIYDPWLYDRDNGQGAAARALEPLMAVTA